MEQQLPKPAETTPETKEQIRLAEALFNKAPHMVAEYKALIKHTGGLLTSSMVYAYNKGLQDAIKAILKENQKNAKKKSFPTPTAPRELNDLKTELMQTQYALGQQQYLASRHAESASELIARMTELDAEINARKELDAATAAETPKTEEPKS